jgi:type VI protein secretion system component VasK
MSGALPLYEPPQPRSVLQSALRQLSYRYLPRSVRRQLRHGHLRLRLALLTTLLLLLWGATRYTPALRLLFDRSPVTQ